MKDSFGGAYLITIIITFFVLFITLLTFVLSYVQVFSRKNQIINYLERKEFKIDTSDNDEIFNFYKVDSEDVSKMQSLCNSSGNSNENNENANENNEILSINDHGVCIKPKESGKYYEVTLYFKFNFFGYSAIFPVSGQTAINPKKIGVS